ncbi:MAG: NUDIX hydrolase [Candidatus Marsarchaeota archaeon]|nr:NUDIX hydrolase [Candidatus Marsarchaeota archaeon]
MKVIYREKYATIAVTKLHGKRGTYSHAITLGRPVAAILPVFYDGSILMEKQYRSAIRRWVYEIPAGHVDGNETPRHAAGRELEEETGYRATKLALMYKAYESPADKNFPMHVFLATGLKKGSQNLEDTERIKLKRASQSRALAMVRDNEIVDMKTIGAILFYNDYINAAKVKRQKLAK